MNDARHDLLTISTFGRAAQLSRKALRLYAQEDGPYELCVPVQHILTTEGEISSRELPAGRIASVMLEGEEARYPASLAGYDAVYDWIHQ